LLLSDDQQVLVEDGQFGLRGTAGREQRRAVGRQHHVGATLGHGGVFLRRDCGRQSTRVADEDVQQALLVATARTLVAVPTWTTKKTTAQTGHMLITRGSDQVG